MSMQIAGKKRIQIILRQTAGYACLGIGIAGCVLPVLPGIPLLFVGLGLLAVDSPRAARLRDWLKGYVARRLSRQRKDSSPA